MEAKLPCFERLGWITSKLLLVQEHTIVYFSLSHLEGTRIVVFVDTELLLRQLQNQCKSEVETDRAQLEGPS